MKKKNKIKQLEKRIERLESQVFTREIILSGHSLYEMMKEAVKILNAKEENLDYMILKKEAVPENQLVSTWFYTVKIWENGKPFLSENKL